VVIIILIIIGSSLMIKLFTKEHNLIIKYHLELMMMVLTLTFISHWWMVENQH